MAMNSHERMVLFMWRGVIYLSLFVIALTIAIVGFSGWDWSNPVALVVLALSALTWLFALFGRKSHLTGVQNRERRLAVLLGSLQGLEPPEPQPAGQLPVGLPSPAEDIYSVEDVPWVHGHGAPLDIGHFKEWDQVDTSEVIMGELEDCCICMEPMETRNSQLKCCLNGNHYVHPRCFIIVVAAGVPRCPLCRGGVANDWHTQASYEQIAEFLNSAEKELRFHRGGEYSLPMESKQQLKVRATTVHRQASIRFPPSAAPRSMEWVNGRPAGALNNSSMGAPAGQGFTNNSSLVGGRRHVDLESDTLHESFRRYRARNWVIGAAVEINHGAGVGSGNIPGEAPRPGSSRLGNFSFGSRQQNPQATPVAVGQGTSYGGVDQP